VVGNFEDFDIKEKIEAVYGSTQSKYKLEGEIQYRLVEVATKEVVWVGSHRPSHTSKEIASFLGDKYFERKGLAEKDKALKIITKGAARELASTIVESVYPIRVVDAKDPNRIVISLGNAGLQPGQILDVYAGQSEFTDPDTGRVFKTNGSKVAALEIVEVNPNYSVAKLIDGEGSKVSNLALLKRRAFEAPAARVQQKERRETPGSNEAPVSW
jgi:hypothetical protein